MSKNQATNIQLQKAQKKEADNIQAIMQQADDMSLSLLFSLRRDYLEMPFNKDLWLVDSQSGDEPNFLLLEQVGDPQVGRLQQPFTALQTALSACHAPGQYSLIFIVTSDGKTNRIYLGVRGHNNPNNPTNSYEFVNNLRNFLQGNWSGTRLRRCGEKEREQLLTLHNMNHAVALTGIPSLKQGDQQGYPQTLDRLIRGMNGKTFAYVVFAEPMDHIAIHNVIHQCRSMLGQVHLLTKMNLTKTTTEGTNNTGTSGSGTGTSTGSSDTELTTSLLIGAQGLASIFPPVGFLTAIASVGLPILSAKMGWQKTYSASENLNFSESIGTNFSLSRAMGQEYINAHAQAAEAHLQRYITRFEQALALGCWNVGVYFLSKQEESNIARQGATQLGALLSGEKSSFEAIRIHDLSKFSAGTVQSGLGNLKQPAIALQYPHPMGEAFSSLTTLLSTEELALLVNLPRREVPGVSIMPTASFSLNPPQVDSSAIHLGTILDGGEPTSLKYELLRKSLIKHALLTGINGSGKSTTCQRLLMEMCKHKTPFLVIEPAKDEYVEWAMAYNAKLPEDSPERIAIYVLGKSSWRGTKLKDKIVLNPFDIVWLSEEHIPQIMSHVDRLKSILNASFPMQEVLPFLLEEILYQTYSLPHNWLGDTLPPFGTPRPTLTQMFDKVQSVTKSRGYGEEITKNLSAALTTRIESLRRSWKGKLFDRPKSTDWKDLFDRPAVINISHLGDDADKSFTMALILQFLYEYRQAQHEFALSEDRENGSLRHLMVIEEAHRIMLRTGQGSMEQANPQAKAAEMFSNILSEIRAYGQGLLIVDQVPSRLIPDAIKNTNLKIVHRLVASDDRNAMGDCMGLTPEQSTIINRLRPGQAIVYGDMDDAAAWVEVKK